MKKSTLHFATILLSIVSLLVVSSCGKDDQPDDPIIDDMVSQEIDGSGGELVIGELMVTIPAGSFEGSHTISIVKKENTSTAFDQLVSASYLVEGFPADYELPFEIRLTTEEELPADSRIVLQEESYSNTAFSTVSGDRILVPTISGNEMWATGLAPEEDELTSSTSEPRENGEISYSIFGIGGYATYTTSDERFVVHFPTNLADQVFSVGDWLADAYEKIETIGFSFDRRTNWPLEVTIKGLPQGVYGYSYNSIWGDNYGYLELNRIYIAGGNEMKATVGHELMHISQNLYDVRNRFSKAKFAGPNLWIDEAVAVWFEGKMLENPDYVSSVFDLEAVFALRGANLASSGAAQAYGYAKAPFIKYIEGQFGIDKIPGIYNQLAADESPFLAINKTLPQPVSRFWPRYIDSLLTFSLYESDVFHPGWFFGNTSKQTLHGTTVGTGTTSLPLSANLYYFEDKNSTYTDKTAVFFKFNDAETDLYHRIHVYKFKAGESVLIDSDLDSVLVRDYDELYTEGYRLLVAVSYAGLNQSRDFDLGWEVRSSPDFGQMKFRIAGDCNYSYMEEDTSYTRQFYDNFSNTIDHTFLGTPLNYNITGNSVTYNYSYSQGNSTYQRAVTIAFDDIEFPEQIESFDISSSVRTESQVTGRITIDAFQFSGEDIPISSPYTDFELEGSISSELISWSHSKNSTYPGSDPPEFENQEMTGFSPVLIRFLF